MSIQRLNNALLWRQQKILEYQMYVEKFIVQNFDNLTKVYKYLITRKHNLMFRYVSNRWYLIIVKKQGNLY